MKADRHESSRTEEQKPQKAGENDALLRTTVENIYLWIVLQTFMPKSIRIQ